MEDVTAESSTRYMLGSNSMLNENSVVSELLTPYGLNDDLALGVAASDKVGHSSNSEMPQIIKKKKNYSFCFCQKTSCP